MTTRPHVLLLGANGQLGRDLLPLLAATGDVTAPGRGRLDLTDEHRLREAVRSLRPSLVVNAAAYNAVDAAEGDAAAAMAVNGHAPGVLAEEAERCGARLLHVSTNYVFDGREGPAWREVDAAVPLSAYGRSKRAGEEAVARTGARALVIRTSWLYGPQGGNFARTVLAAARAGRRLEVVDDQHGAPTLVADLAQALVALIEQDAFRQGGELLHLAGAGRATWHAFAEAVVREAGLSNEVWPVPTARHPRPAARPANGLLDTTKARESFGVSLPEWRTSLTASRPADWSAESR
jgi:dTDP-4-dehydrorhamnose reductase